MLRPKSRSGYLEFGQKKHSSFLLRTISGSKICRGDALASQVDKAALVSVDRNSASLSENRIVKAAMMQKQISSLEEELKNTKERLDEAETERNRVIAGLREARELANAGLSPTKAEQVFSELKSLKYSLSNSINEIESRDNQISLLNNRLESANVFEIQLAERDASLEESQKRILELEDQVLKTKQSESNLQESLTFQRRQIEQTNIELEESKLQVNALNEKLNNRQKLKKNLDQNGFNSSPDTKTLKDEIVMLKNELKLATEAEEKSKKAMDDLASVLREVATEASTAKEKLKTSEEHVTELKQEIKQLIQELELQTNTSNRLKMEAEESISAWTAKELGFISCIRKADEETASLKRKNEKLIEETIKLRDIVKQALDESSVAKESSIIAQAENSELQELLAEKEASLRFVTKENERLRNNQVESHEHKDPHKLFNKEDGAMFDQENDAKIAVDDDDDVEKIQGLVFGTASSSGTEPRILKTKARVPGNEMDYGDSGQPEEVENSINVNGSSSSGSVNYKEDSEDKGFYMYGIYNSQKLFRKIGELVTGNTSGRKDGSLEQVKEEGKEDSKADGYASPTQFATKFAPGRPGVAPTPPRGATLPSFRPI